MRGARRGNGVVAIAAVLAALGLAACGSGGEGATEAGADTGSGEGGGEIVLGAAVGESGFLAPYELPNFKAFNLAVSEINAEGGVDGRQLKVISRDMRSIPAEGRAVTEQLIGRGAEIMITPADYDYGSPAALYAVEHGLLAVSLGAASIKFGPQAIGPTAFTPMASALTDGAAGSEFALKRGWKTAFVLLDDTLAYTKESCKGFSDNFESGGGTIVGSDTYKQEDTSATALIADIKQASPPPAVIQICSYPPGMTGVLRQLRAAGLQQPIITNVGGDGDYWLDGVPNLSDFYVSTGISIWGDDPDPAVNEFVRNYAKRYGEPLSTGLAAQGYAAAQLVAKAVEQSGGTTDGAALAETLETWSGEELLPGPATFTEEVHITLDRPMRVVEYTNGKPHFVELVELERPPEYGI